MTLTATSLRDFPPVVENIERPDTLSQTLLAKHNKCPRSAYLYRKYKGGTGSHAMGRGILFHEVADQAINELLEQEEAAMPGEVAKELADAVMAEHPEIPLSTDEQDAVRLMAYNWAEGTIIDPAAVVAVEMPLQFEIGGFTLTCRLDLVEAHGSTLYVRDWKTSLAIRKSEEIQKGFQGLFYALACIEGEDPETGARIGGGIQDVWFYETYPRYRTEEGPLLAREGSWTRAEIHEFKGSLERNVAAFERSLETGDWPTRDGSWCSECPAQGECPIPEHLRELPQIETEEDAHNAFSRKLALERESRRLQSGLRGFVKDNGPLFHGDYAFDARLEEQKKVKDWNELILALQRTSELGTPFEMTEHIEIRKSTKFAKRKLTPEEMEERDGDH
jgi:hypothetical protein